MIINVTDSKNLNRLNSVLPKKDFFLWFYADWCGHCKTMEPEWEKLVKTCGKKYNLARVRDDQKDQLINNLGSSVQGFPTLGSTNLKNSNNNSNNNSGYDNNDNDNNNDNNNDMFNTYQGPRDSSNFFNFIKKNLVAEKLKRSMKRRGAMKHRKSKSISPCAMKRRKGKSISPCAMKRRGNNSRKRIVFVKPKKGCGGKSKKFRAVNL